MTKPRLLLSFLFLAVFASSVATAGVAVGQLPAAPAPQPGSVSGYVNDPDGAAIPHATVTAQGTSPEDQHTTTADDSGFFRVSGLAAGVSYKVTATAKGFGASSITTTPLLPGLDFNVSGLALKPSAEVSVAAASAHEIAVEEEHEEEHQRVFGIIPNFYVVYDRQDEVPLTAALKFKLAFKTSFDAATLAGAIFVGGIDQAAVTPAYPEGARGFGQRIAASYAGAVTDVMIGGAVLPSLLHQDPRYYYQGTGTRKSRILHALSSPIICRGDNGHKEFNFSSVGGDLASGALSEIYYPPVDRGPGLVFSGALIVTGGREVNALLQEFLFSRLTTHPKPQQ